MLTKNQKVGIGLGFLTLLAGVGIAIAKSASVSSFDPWTYDANGDGYISLTEVLKAINDWKIGGLITEEQVQQVDKLYKGHIHKGG